MKATLSRRAAVKGRRDLEVGGGLGAVQQRAGETANVGRKVN